MNLEDLDIEKEITIKIKENTVSDYASLTTNPDELYDLFLVIHYKLGSA